jgi:hypothetical protein
MDWRKGEIWWKGGDDISEFNLLAGLLVDSEVTNDHPQRTVPQEPSPNQFSPTAGGCLTLACIAMGASPVLLYFIHARSNRH